jgi:hypothetical protein
MAVLTAKSISSLAIDLLVRSIVLPRTVSIIPGGEYAGPNGDTITVRVPQPGSARTQVTRGATITYDDVVEVPVDVQLSHLYHAKLTSDEEMSLDIENFGRQITRVQVSAVAEGAEDELASVMNDLTGDGTVDPADPEAGILEAREWLGENDAPSSDRYLAVSPSFASVLLQYDKFTKVNESGASDALRNAILGRIFGFWVVESNALDTGTAVAYHKSGFTMANRVPVAPRGANDSATASSQGLGLRQVFQYVPDKLSDASVVSTFAGAAAVYDGDSGDESRRFYKLELGS